MTMKIISQKEEKLLSRIDVKAHITFEQATLSNEDVAKEIGKQLKKDVKLVVVKQIKTYYGSREADVDALVYDSEEAKQTTERTTKAMKDAAAKKAEEAAAPAEEKTEEAPKKAAPVKEEKADAPKEEKKVE